MGDCELIIALGLRRAPDAIMKVLILESLPIGGTWHEVPDEGRVPRVESDRREVFCDEADKRIYESIDCFVALWASRNDNPRRRSQVRHHAEHLIEKLVTIF